jgi:hypothetical protein
MGQFTTTGTKITWKNPTIVPDSQKQNGGWYANPATGSVDQWSTDGGGGQNNSSGGNGGDSGGGGSTGDPALDLIKSVTEPLFKQLETYNNKATEFDKNNPFVMDTILGQERDKVKQRLDPYYTQTLGDFLTGIDQKRKRGIEDERTLLTELNQDTTTYTGNQKLQVQDAIEKSREGAADAGLYTSGAALREQGKIEQQSGQDLSTYLTNTQRKTDEIKKTQDRNAQDLALAESQKKRDLGQEQYYQTESQAQTGYDTAAAKRTFEKGQFTGPPPTADPNQFSNYLYNMVGRA